MIRHRTIYAILTITGLFACVDAQSQTTITSTTGGGTVTTNPAAPATGVSVTAVSANPDVTVTTGNTNSTSAFHIFNSSSTELMRVQSDGKVGIGTANPGQLLTVSGGDVSIRPSANNAAASMGTLGFGPSIAAGGTYRTVKNAYMEGYTQGPGWYSGTQLRFLTHPGPDTTIDSPIVRMIIDKDGNVGIGTLGAGTGSKLSVSVGNVGGVAVSSSNSGFLEVGKFGADRWRWANDYNFANHLELLVSTSGADPGTRLIDVTSSGNVGIGTSPTSRFEIGTFQSPVQFQETSTVGLPHGILLNMPGNSEIDVAGLQIGNTALPQINVPSGILYLQNTAGDVNIGGGTGTGAHGNLTVAGSVTAGTVYANYQDVAEWVPAAQSMPAGTVVVISDDANNTVTPSTSAYDTGVAGVVSPTPGLLLGVGSESKAKIATTGRVKVRVDASKYPIRKGDLLVTSDCPGMAMKSEPLDIGGTKIHRPGTLIGKALEPLANGEGEILVLLSLQ